jgi:hypothetical protein
MLVLMSVLLQIVRAIQDQAQLGTSGLMNMMKVRHLIPPRHLRQPISACYNINMTNTKLQKIILFSIILLSSFFVSQINQAQAYTPPIGIPDPGFGIESIRPARPISWNEPIAILLYKLSNWH